MANIVITDVGLQALINAQQTGTNAITIASIQLGSGKYTPSADRTALENPIKSLTALSGGATGDNMIHVSATDSSTDTYDAYEAGVFLDDGTLFAVTSQDTPLLSKASSSKGLISFDFPVVQASEGQIVINGDESFWNPIATTETYGVVKLATTEQVKEPAETSNVITTGNLRDLFDSPAFMAGVIGNTPNYYKRSALPTSNRTTITIPEGTQVNINGSGYISSSDVTLDVSTLGAASDRAGKDAYIYACQSTGDSTEPVFVLSLNSTVPDGYTEDNSRKIGGFHCLCLSVGTIDGHALSGYETGDILPTTIWDLLFRCDLTSGNEGMFYSSVGTWHGIYLASWDGEKIVSVYGGEIIDGYSTMAMHGEKFAEYFGKIHGRLPYRDEFVHYAKGSNEGTNIQNSSDPVTTGGHVDTAGRRMISDEGAEDCCGVEYQWTRDMFGVKNRKTPDSATIANAYQHGGVKDGEYWYVDWYRWDDPNQTHDSNTDCNNGVGYSRLYQQDVDGDDTNNLGDMYGALMRFRVGGAWSSGSGCGSRCVALLYLSAYRSTGDGARCAAESRVVNL